MVFPLCSEPGLTASDPGSIFVLTRFLHAKRYPLRSKTLWLPVASAGHALFSASIVNAAADGKRLRAIDAFSRSAMGSPNGRKTAYLRGLAAR
jgi:hypothetical protein